MTYGEVLGAELPLGPRDALRRTPVGPSPGDRALEVGDRAGRVSAQAGEPGAPAQRVEIAAQREHAPVRVLGLGVLADLEARVAENPPGVRVGGVEGDRP